MSTPQKKGRLPGRPQQPAPTKVRIVTGEGINLSAKHKRILGQARRFASDTLDCLDEIDNNVTRGERWFFVENATALKRCICDYRRLCRAVATVAQHAKRMEARS